MALREINFLNSVLSHTGHLNHLPDGATWQGNRNSFSIQRWMGCRQIRKVRQKCRYLWRMMMPIHALTGWKIINRLVTHVAIHTLYTVSYVFYVYFIQGQSDTRNYN
jgi:hypothetical protein